MTLLCARTWVPSDVGLPIASWRCRTLGAWFFSVVTVWSYSGGHTRFYGGNTTGALLALIKLCILSSEEINKMPRYMTNHRHSKFTQVSTRHSGVGQFRAKQICVILYLYQPQPPFPRHRREMPRLWLPQRLPAQPLSIKVILICT
jgi:hypothetical protein